MYTENEIVRIAKRENNNKRKYLVVNRLQGKHIPVKAEQAFNMFDELAEQLVKEYKDEKVLMVGFAETATAIGARLAVKLECAYMQTTREPIPDVEYLYFTESHSHATEQKLIKTDLDQIIGTIDRIIFAEDEVTTGNTIMKIIEIIKNTYEEKVKFSVACLLNGMDENAQKIYEQNEISMHYLVKTDHSKYTQIAEAYKGDGVYNTQLAVANEIEVKNCDANQYLNARRLVDGKEYQQACENLWQQISSNYQFESGAKVLVVGTEEFMYPAIYVAYKIQELGCEAKTHSTTRSPITVSSEELYPVHQRYELRSLYDEERKTFIYDIEKYDKVFIITDSITPTQGGVMDLCNAIASNGNTDITLIRWCEK